MRWLLIQLVYKELSELLALRPGSDAALFMSRTLFELRIRPAKLIQMPILIPAELNSEGEKRAFQSNCLHNTL